MSFNINTSEDRESVLFASYNKALKYKKNGEFEKAIIELEKSCNPPSICTGHYEELFKIWRKQNSEDLRNSQYDSVVNRIKKMIRYDSEMLTEMTRYWSDQHNKEYSPDYFAGYSNLKIADAKTLLTTASKLMNDELMKLSNVLLARFSEE